MRKVVFFVTLAATLACGSGDAPIAEAPRPAAPAEVGSAPAPADDLADGVAYYDANHLYTEAELRDLTLWELSIRRNTIFARAGNPFRKAWLDGYFRSQPWYTPKDAMDPRLLTDVDRKNATMVATVEGSLTKDQLRERQARVWEGPNPDIEAQLLSAALGEWGATGVDDSQRNPLEDPTMLDRELTDAHLADLSRRDLRLLRNTVFARHGRAFKSEILQSYFAQKVWYTIDPAYADDRLTAVDKANVEKIVALEQSLGGMLTDAEHSALTDAEVFYGA